MSNRPYLEAISIENFRCLQKLNIQPLSRVNLIAGRNSVGKTALLEATFLLTGAENLESTLRVSHFRGRRELKGELASILELLWAPLFHNLNPDNLIKITAQSGSQQQGVEIAVTEAQSKPLNISLKDRRVILSKSEFSSRQILTQTYTETNGQSTTFKMYVANGNLHIEPVPSTSPVSSYFISSRHSSSEEDIANLFGRLIRSKQVEQLDLVEILKIVEPRLVQLEVIPSAGYSMIYGDIGLDQMLPLSLMGDGISRMMDILLRIANAADGVVLIDEIENGLHHSILEDFWRIVDRAARTFNTQVITTTHSYECIQEAHSAFSLNEDYGFALHRLDRIDGQIDAVTYDREALEAALNNEFEIR